MGRLIDDGPELNQTLLHDHSGGLCDACKVGKKELQDDQTADSGPIVELERKLRAAETRADVAEQLNTILRNMVRAIVEETDKDLDNVPHLKAA